MDRSSMIGILLGAAAVIGGNLLEGGKITAIFQMTAAVIVVGGTTGATLLSFPLSDLLKAVASLRDIFLSKNSDPEVFVKDIIHYSTIARRNGLIALEPEIAKIDDYFLRRGMSLMVDGMGPKILKETMEQENITYEDEQRRIAKVFETAGGFAPTIGIIGAVLGLIHVMENLSDPSKLGAGIAVAFVATIYGVGSANLILLPISKKLVHLLNNTLTVREMVIEGVTGIQSGLNPHYLEEKLRAFLKENRRR
ncbi:MAG: flagellar motor protein [Thermodesulfovibrionales bacterium]|jgi:chemotaxis protein MotA